MMMVSTRRYLLALVALLLLASCVPSGPGDDTALVHRDPKPRGHEKVAVAESETVGPVCSDDGQTGKRVQAVYLVAADKPDRYAEIAPSIGAWAGRVDQAVSDSAARWGKTGRVRWVCTGGQIDVVHLVGSAASDDTWYTTRDALRAAGHSRVDRKYLVWVDAAVYCGIAGTTTSPETTTGYARVDRACWGLTYPVELHELAHTLGAVSKQAKHSNGKWHCTDEYDRMCYNEGTAMTYPCQPYTDHEALLDCNGDDYFNAGPTPPPMPVNLALSSYLQITRRTASGATAPPTTSSGA